MFTLCRVLCVGPAPPPSVTQQWSSVGSHAQRQALAQSGLVLKGLPFVWAGKTTRITAMDSADDSVAGSSKEREDADVSAWRREICAGIAPSSVRFRFDADEFRWPISNSQWYCCLNIVMSLYMESDGMTVLRRSKVSSSFFNISEYPQRNMPFHFCYSTKNRCKWSYVYCVTRSCKRKNTVNCLHANT